MSKSITNTVLETDTVLSASGTYTSAAIDVSEVTGFITVGFKVKGTSTALSGDVVLKILESPKATGGIYDDPDEGVPLYSKTDATTSYHSVVRKHDVTGLDSLKIYFANPDDTNTLTYCLEYSIVSL